MQVTPVDDKIHKASFLAGVPLFSGVSIPDLERIGQQAKEYRFEAGEVIIHEGESDRRFFFIVSGKVRIVKSLGRPDEKVLKVMGPREYFGEMALIDELTRSASVVAGEIARILILDQLDLRKEIEKYPAMAIELLRTLSRRLRAMEATVIHTLGSLLPICANCKRIREANGVWTNIEEYISRHSDTEFSHGICPECMRQLYPEFVDRVTLKGEDKKEG
jgi:CRP/FNR family cyclic AMP-dependent transcriptional regulator